MSWCAHMHMFEIASHNQNLQLKHNFNRLPFDVVCQYTAYNHKLQFCLTKTIAGVTVTCNYSNYSIELKLSNTVCTERRTSKTATVCYLFDSFEVRASLATLYIFKHSSWFGVLLSMFGNFNVVWVEKMVFIE